jgi:hypothetical protein
MQLLTGLLGVTSAMARVFGVIKVAQRSTEGINPSSGLVGKGTVLTPRRLFVILFQIFWLTVRRTNAMTSHNHILMIEIPGSCAEHT